MVFLQRFESFAIAVDCRGDHTNLCLDNSALFTMRVLCIEMVACSDLIAASDCFHGRYLFTPCGLEEALKVFPQLRFVRCQRIEERAKILSSSGRRHLGHDKADRMTI